MRNKTIVLSLPSLTEKVKQIAEEAGKIILDFYESDFSSSIELKEDKSPVTIADKTANEFIVKKLLELNSDIPVIAEESIIVSFSERKKWPYLWIVDPLDGTKEFINKNGEFTVNIALVKQKIPVLGVVFAPVQKKMYWAFKGSGAFMKSDNIISKINANRSDLKGKNLKVVLSRSHLDSTTMDYLSNFYNPETIFRGSSLKFMDIACGDADLYFRLNSVMEWDTAASHIIIKESGADLVNIKNGKNIFYNKKSLKIPGFIVFRKLN